MVFIDDYAGYGNEILYNMCERKPLHNDIDVINSKLWIIGRSYSAAIERGAGAKFKIENASQIIMDSELDKLIKNVSKINRPTLENINKILEVHSYFTNLLFKATGLYKRSLASKYLHFHSPKAFFIYDSIAEKEIRRHIKESSKNTSKRFKITKNYDDRYEAFVYRCIYYRDNFLEDKPDIKRYTTPRRLDKFLLGY